MTTTIHTQLRAQTVTTGRLVARKGRLEGGTLVSLQWERSHRREEDGPLLHSYTAFGYSAGGEYVMEYVHLADLEDVGFSTGAK